MQIELPRAHARRIWRAIIEFELLEPEDRVLVGFSGGKDSLFLLYALKALQAKAPFTFFVGAAHVDLGFPDPSDFPHLERCCRDLDVPFYPRVTQVFKSAFREGGANPCSTCAYFRRAIVNQVANSEGYNKVALAHHHDDAVETFLMGQLYSGRLQALPPRSLLDKSGLTVIRPLVYLREAKIAEFVAGLPWKPMGNRCPLEGKTQRFAIKQLIRKLTSENSSVYNNIAAAMRESKEILLWPPKADSQGMYNEHKKLMGQAPIY